MEFTQEQKALIWETIIAPNNGTEAEAKAFIYTCELHGLDPLAKDIVFSKFETKHGPRVSYIVTRDGLLKNAMRDKQYKKLMSGVVKQGDHFQMDVANGLVEHKFGDKRGKIEGSWAVVEHRERGPLAVFVDFQEYFVANAASQKGKNYVWDSMPSAMISKVAESIALKRQFPLGTGIYTEEEISVEQTVSTDTPSEPVSSVSNEDTGTPVKEVEKATPPPLNNSAGQQRQTAKDTKPQESKEKTTKQAEKPSEPKEQKESTPKTKDQPKVEKPNATNEVNKPSNDDQLAWETHTIKTFKEGVMPNREPFYKIVFENESGEQFLALTKEPAVMTKTDEIGINQKITVQIDRSRKKAMVVGAK